MNKFYRGFWSHDRFMDVFVEVLKVSYVDSNRTKLKIRWWSKSQVGEPYMISFTPQNITVDKQEYRNWNIFTPVVSNGY